MLAGCNYRLTDQDVYFNLHLTGLRISEVRGHLPFANLNFETKAEELLTTADSLFASEMWLRLLEFLPQVPMLFGRVAG